jgi:predicted RND superfamily exporter protein
LSLTTLPTRRPWLVVVCYFLVAGAAIMGLFRLKEEQNLLVFLPTDDPDVQLFNEVSSKFRSVHVAMIGVDAPASAGELGVFSPPVLSKIQAATDAMGKLNGVGGVTSLTHIVNFVAGPVGAEVRELVEKLPANDDEARALKTAALARRHVNGVVVSKDGRAALILVFLLDDTPERVVTDQIRDIAKDKLSGLNVYFTGAPFAGRAIYEEAQADVRKLSPLALVMLLLVVILSFRDPVGVVLTVASVVFSVMVVLGGMGWWGEKFTVASSTLPVILFASGSSYAVHVLGRYYLLRHGRDAKSAVEESLRIVGPPLLIAAVTTAVGFFSFVATDVRPMRAFGFACGAGVLICWLTSLTLVPAVVVLWPRKAQTDRRLSLVGDALVALWNWSRSHRWVVIIVAVAAAGALVAPMLRVKVRMEPRTFFRHGSEPWLAEKFMEDRFGGAHFIQIPVHGDLTDPWTLREVARVIDFARGQKGVTQVQGITDILMIGNEVMGSGDRLPSTQRRATDIYFSIEGQIGIDRLLAGRKDALLVLRIASMSHKETEALTDRLEAFAKTVRAKPGKQSVEDIADRVSWVTHGDRAKILDALKTAALPADTDPAWTERRMALVTAFFSSEEAPPFRSPEQRDKIIAALKTGADWKKDLAAAAPSPEEGQLAVAGLDGRLGDARREFAVNKVLPALDLIRNPERVPDLPAPRSAKPSDSAELAAIVDDLFIDTPAAPADPLTVRIAGEPILDRGFSRSVENNQWRSLGIAVAVVLALMTALFRSLRQGLVSMTASLFTMVVLFGVMGLMHINIDLGTSLVAGIATGAGSDFAMHYMWYLRHQSADEVSRTVGPVMVVSILLVGLGFIVLALGRSPVMHLFGTLAGLAMILSALFTCLLVPALLNKVGQGGRPTNETQEH